jgi:heme exporter protein A
MQLIAEKLGVSRGGRLLFAGLSFAVAAGEALLVTGPNGAGKTTLLRTLAGFLPPEAGQIRLDGGAADAGIGEQCHFVGHANAVKPGLTVAENAAFWRGFLDGAHGEAPGSGRDRLDAALATFGLEGLRDIPAGYLSAGQRRRAGPLRWLVARRPSLLLGQAGQEVLAGVVNAHLAGGGLVLAATHLRLAFDRARELPLARSAATAA